MEIRVPKLGSARLVVYEVESPGSGLGDGCGSRRWGGHTGAIERASVALTNMGATTIHATETEHALANGASIEDAAALAAEGTEPSVRSRCQL